MGRWSRKWRFPGLLPTLLPPVRLFSPPHSPQKPPTGLVEGDTISHTKVVRIIVVMGSEGSFVSQNHFCYVNDMSKFHSGNLTERGDFLRGYIFKTSVVITPPRSSPTVVPSVNPGYCLVGDKSLSSVVLLTQVSRTCTWVLSKNLRLWYLDVHTPKLARVRVCLVVHVSTYERVRLRLGKEWGKVSKGGDSWTSSPTL